jgi:hypothetical protein
MEKSEEKFFDGIILDGSPVKILRIAKNPA